MKRKNKANKIAFQWGLLVLTLMFVLVMWYSGLTKPHELTTGELLEQIKEQKVTEITITPKSSESVYEIEGKLSDYSKKEYFTARVISEEIETITKYAKDQEIKE